MATNTPVQQLPFVTSPVIETMKVGNERTGVLEFPVYNDLTVNEQVWLQANGATKTAFAYTSKVALKIARSEKVKPLEAHNFVAKILANAMGAEGLEMSEKEAQWAVKYVQELEDAAIKVLEVSTQQSNALVTCVIRHRLKGMEAWSLADTTNMPTELVELIYAFALKEQNRGSYDSVEEAAEDLEEMLGKSTTEAIKTAQESTGEPASMSSESSSPETPTSPESDSASSTPAT